MASTLELLGFALMNQGKLAEAEPAFREALAIQKKLLGTEHPDVAKSVNNLASLLQSLGKLAEARLVLSEVPGQAPDNDAGSVGSLSSRGDMRARAGRWKDAAEDFSKAVELQPANHEFYHALAPLLVQSGDLEGCRRFRQSVIARFGSSGDSVVAERMAKDCLILPSSGADLDTVSKMADTAVRMGTNHPALTWFQFAKGLAECLAPWRRL